VVVTCRRISVRCFLWQAEPNPSCDCLQLLDLRALAGWLSWPRQAGSPGGVRQVRHLGDEKRVLTGGPGDDYDGLRPMPRRDLVAGPALDR